MPHRPTVARHHSSPARHSGSPSRRVALVCSAVAVALSLAACGSASSTAREAGAPPSAAPSDSTATSGLVLDDGWVKAVEAAPVPSMPSTSASPAAGPSSMGATGAMTAMFGTLRNTTDHAVTVTGGRSPAAGVVEVHEVVRTGSGAMQMQPKPGGIIIPAGGSHVLRPGADHVMLMDLSGPLEVGASAVVTLTTSDDDVSLTVPVRAFSGAEESYEPTPSSS